MSDPAVYNDHREAAEVGRRLKELEAAHKLAQEWREVSDDLEAARDDGDLRELVPELEERMTALEEELRLALVESDPADAKDVLVEVRQAAGGDEAALWAGDVYRMLARYAERRGYKSEVLSSSPNDGGGFKEVTFAIKGDGAYSVFKWEGGTHRVQRVPADRVSGPDPHVDRNGRGHARGRRGRDRDRPERPQDRRLPLDRPRWPEREHDGLGRPHHACPDRPRRRDAGREVAAPEQGEGDAGPPRAGSTRRSGRSSARSRMRRAARRSAPASGPRRSGRTTFRRTGSPTTGSSSRSTGSTRSSRAISTSSPRR